MAIRSSDSLSSVAYMLGREDQEGSSECELRLFLLPWAWNSFQWCLAHGLSHTVIARIEHLTWSRQQRAGGHKDTGSIKKSYANMMRHDNPWVAFGINARMLELIGNLRNLSNSLIWEKRTTKSQETRNDLAEARQGVATELGTWCTCHWALQPWNLELKHFDGEGIGEGGTKRGGVFRSGAEGTGE